MGNLAEGESPAPTSSQTQSTPATSPDTGIGHENDVVEVTSLHGTGGFLARQAMPVVVGV